MNIFDHIDILIPLITFSFAFGGAAFVFKNNIRVLDELRKVIEKLEVKVDGMEAYYIKDMKKVMTKSMCEEETNHCTKSRDKVRDSLEKKIDEIQACINLQDLKRHETNNKTHACWLEIHEKLATIQANQEANKVMFGLHGVTLKERSDHAGRIEALEKLAGVTIKVNRGRREGDVV
jgi:chaperonin cofactor prefoldin